MRSVSSKNLQLLFSAASVCVAAVLLVMVLYSSVVNEDGLALELSRGRDLALIGSITFLAGSAFLLFHCVRIPREAEYGDAETEPEASTVGVAVVTNQPVDDSRDTVIRSLSEDEQRLYRIIADGGGVVLQMHVVSSGIFSKAKVTRLLDKLEKRELVVRERHGMTNRIRIIK